MTKIYTQMCNKSIVGFFLVNNRETNNTRCKFILMKFLYTTIILILTPLILCSQDISGKIIDSDNNLIIGAYMVNARSLEHYHTNEIGNFTISDAQIGDTISISYLGYEKFNFVVNKFEEGIEIELQPSSIELSEIVVNQNRNESNVLSSIDVILNPVKSSQELLRKVPGLFIGQHAGGGKAEQIFLRGFDIDHGTDIDISVDGMPVNMVSHAHGQGYSDLHFIIPETVDHVDFGKGPYYGDKGNFGTAGYVSFKTKDKLEHSLLSVEAGRFNTVRSAALLNLIKNDDHNLYLASEYHITDGPFESSQDFSRRNIMLKYSGMFDNNSILTVIASNFYSKWDASGQIPVRLVNNGTITRFGAVDDTEGGITGRSNIAVNFTQPIDKNTFIKSNIFYSRYNFELYSNFTFFLEDPINGDQIRQKENRDIWGLQSVWHHELDLDHVEASLKVGIGGRFDQVVDNELSYTKNRTETLDRIQFGDVDEKNLYAFSEGSFELGKWNFEPSVRFDFFKFNYLDLLDTLYNNQSKSASLISPKFNIIYNLNRKVQLFAKSGIGFHSNDSRVIIEEEADAIVPRAYGIDLGANYKPLSRLYMNTALWYLFSEQEFVYVGDAGIVEPSGQTRRLGLDVGLRYQLNKWLFANGDFTYSHARSVDVEESASYIPLAPVITTTAGINIDKGNLKAGVQFRYLQDRPANEDNSIVAKGYNITDVNASYQMGHIILGLTVENVFNQEWNEAQFATESRLRNELNAVEEIHFTPGTPLFIKGSVKYQF